MPYLTIPISPGGPILDIAVSVSVPHARALQKLNQAVPQSIQIRALIDTGASGTCIDPQCLNSLGLTPKNQIPIHTPSTGGTPQLCDQYDISLVLIHPRLSMTIQAIPVIASQLAVQGIQALIGRDVLSRCLLVYDGSGARCSLGF